MVASSTPAAASNDAALAIGESWEFSTFPDRESYALGRPLSQVLHRPLPFIAKLLDTARALSVQVHPEDAPETGVLGKEEAWVVLDADADAHVYAGVRDDISTTEFAQIVWACAHEPNRAPELFAAMNRIRVESGSIVLIPPGTVHTISGGLHLAEIQQPCDVTLRLFDFGSDRPLQITQALAAIDLRRQARIWHPSMLTQSSNLKIRGRRIELTVLRGGDHTIEVLGDELLLIPALGRCKVGSGNDEEDLQPEVLQPGALRLCTWGSIACSVEPGGIAVVGRMLTNAYHTVAQMID
jgi:mannose-6-phosphate isomerase class I